MRTFFKRSNGSRISFERSRALRIAQLSPEEPSAEGLFRYQVLSQVFARENNGQLRSKAIKAVSAIEHLTVDKKVRKVSRRSIYRWLSAFERHGFIGLVPAKRTEKKKSQVLAQSLIDFFKDQKKTGSEGIGA